MTFPLNSLAFDIDGVVADIMTTFLDLARTRYNVGHHLRYEHMTTFQLEECLDLEPDIIQSLIRELINRPHELTVEPLPTPSRSSPAWPGRPRSFLSPPGTGPRPLNLAHPHPGRSAARRHPGGGHRRP